MLVSPDSLFAAMAHETRLRALMLLVGEGELCVCELTHALGLSQPHVSRHLAQLRELGLVRDRREGTWVYYRIVEQEHATVARALGVLTAEFGAQRALERDHIPCRGARFRSGSWFSTDPQTARCCRRRRRCYRCRPRCRPITRPRVSSISPSFIRKPSWCCKKT